MWGLFLVLCLGQVGIPYVSAQTTSLYVPGFDPQPLSADVAGVDSAGRTTWVLQKGTGTDDEAGDIGTVTLVEGPDFVSLTMANSQFTLGKVASISNGLAIFTGSEGTVVVTETETVSPIAVQIGTTPTSGATKGSGAASQSANPTGSTSASVPTNAARGGSSAPVLAVVSWCLASLLLAVV